MICSKRIAVIGAGVIGLSTALRLRQSGHNVTLITAATADQPQVTSVAAAAFWHPFQVHEPADAPGTVRQLAERTLERLLPLAKGGKPEIGVVLQAGEEYVDAQSAHTLHVPPWWSERAELDFRLLTDAELPPESPQLGAFAAGSRFRLPVVHMGAYMASLRREFEAANRDAAGAPQPTIEVGRVVCSLDEIGDAAGKRFDCIVNCAGIGAAPLAADRVLHPLQGQVVVAPPESGLVRRCQKLVFVDAGKFAADPVYIVPRATHGDVVLGGTVVDIAGGSALDAAFDWGALEHWTPDPAVGRRILARCAALEPAVASFAPSDADLAARYMKVGLRPARAPLRIEADLSHAVPVIHNYGHGGAGLTLSWGSALEVERLLAEVC